MGILLVPGVIQDVEADHNRHLWPVAPSDLLSTIECGTSQYGTSGVIDCTGINVSNAEVIFEKHHDPPSDYFKVELFAVCN